MANEEIIRLLFSLLGGGIAVAILNWIRLNKAELRERKSNFLDLQLEKRGVAEKVRTDLLTKKSYRLSDIERMERGRQKINNMGLFIIFFGYSAYLLIRFIVWAIGTLKQK